MSLGFRCFLIVLICFFALWVYHKREGELSIWMGLSQPPPAEPPAGPAPFSGIVGNDTIIETTIKPAPFSNGAHFPVRRNQASRWDRPSITAAEPEGDEPGGDRPRRLSANPSAVGSQPGAGGGGEVQFGMWVCDMSDEFRAVRCRDTRSSTFLSKEFRE